MIKSLTVRNYLEEEIVITLTEAVPEHGLLLSNVTGIGAAEGIINISDFATIDGGLYNSSRKDKRSIELEFIFTEIPKIEDARHLTYKYFPVDKPVTLIFETDRRTSSITGYVKSNTPAIFSEREGTTIEIICDDPYFYEYGDMVPHQQSWSVLEPMFEFEYENAPAPQKNTIFSEYIIRDKKIITYDGEGSAGFVTHILVLSPVGDITIEKVTTREVFRIYTSKIGSITGSALQAGDEIIISTYPKNRKIYLLRNGKTIDILNAIARDSDWFMLDKGDNYFAYKTADNLETYLMFYIETMNIYEGV